MLSVLYKLLECEGSSMSRLILKEGDSRSRLEEGMYS